MNSTAWKVTESESGIEYRLQINQVPWKYRRAILDAMQDWQQVSYGWYLNTGNQVLIFGKTFKNEDEWQRWATRFPLDVEEVRYWGEKKKVITYKKAG